MLLTFLHLAPNAPWPWLALLTLAFLALALWAYRFTIPPLPLRARRLLPTLRLAALALLAWLLAQPVLERTTGAGARLIVLLDRSRSMDLADPGHGGRPGLTRAHAADRAVEELQRAWRGRAQVTVMPFATRLGAAAGAGASGSGASASGSDAGRAGTALGDALLELGRSAEGQSANGVVVVSDGAVNAGEDPVAAARSLGVPVHAVVVGSGGPDRAVTDVESPGLAQVGHRTLVRARLTSTEARGTPILARLLEGGAERARATVIAPGPGQEASAEFTVTPLKPGLEVWTVAADSLAGEVSPINNARQVAVEVAPGRLGVTIVSDALNWDLTFLRRALAGDSSLAVTTFVRRRSEWQALEHGRAETPDAAALRGQTVVVLDAVSPAAVGPGFDAALATLVRGGGGLMALGGAPPGLSRYSAGALGRDLTLAPGAGTGDASIGPEPRPEARELLGWDDDPARGDQAWRAAAPLTEVAPVAAGPGDRVLIAARGAPGSGPPLVLLRRVGRGQALLVNGTGLWRWSLSGHDDLTAERARRLWRRIVHALAEPVQGEPLRVRPERWLTPGGETVRLFATLQDSSFRPVAGARVEGEIEDGAGHSQRIAFEPGGAGSYVAAIESPAPGHYRVSARASAATGRELGRAASEFAVDRWSLEEARTLPDSATLAAVARASGGRVTDAAGVARWARSLPTHALARARTESVRLWESPWVFAFAVGALAVEWAWRRRRGLP